MVTSILSLLTRFILSLARPFLCCLRALPGEKSGSSSPIRRRTKVRSLPLAWTNLALPDPFRVGAGDTAVLRFEDLQQLVQLLRQEQTHEQEGH